MHNNYTLEPKVDETQEFIEIANDFSNPLDLVREAISNAFDANAKNIEINFNVIKEFGESVLEIFIRDDGDGMDENGLQSFFDLGNSLSRNVEDKIGEKGHGTKVYFNSSRIEVTTIKKMGTKKLVAVMEEPIKKLHNREKPKAIVDVFERQDEETNGTSIRIKGYNLNRREKFTHEHLKDYILWFTKFGSIEKYFGREENLNAKIILKGLNRSLPDVIDFGHPFPDESRNVNELFDKYIVSAPDYYCRRVVKEGHLKNYPEISYEAVFSVEGNKVKQSNNTMVRRKGVTPIPGSYTVAERYGVWICKDFIPIQRKNEWVNYKGNEYIKLHAFFNCQGVSLTANRGSIDNTPTEILLDIEAEIKEIYEKIIESEEWTQLSWLEQEADAYRTSEKEKKDFDWRTNRVSATG